jgi:hypothetical protein
VGKGKFFAMRPSKLVLYLTVFITSFVAPLHATMLIIIYTPDGYWIGADSARSKDSIRLGTVCKVHQTKWGLLVKMGTEIAAGFDGHEYSTDEEIQALLKTSNNVEEFKTQVEAKYHADIDAELAYDLKGLYAQDPSGYPPEDPRQKTLKV